MKRNSSMLAGLALTCVVGVGVGIGVGVASSDANEAPGGVGTLPAWVGHLRSATPISTGAAPYPTGTAAWKISYDTTSPLGGRVVSSGLLLVPPGTPPPGGWPVVAWDHGTTGIGDDCAASDIEGAAYGELLGEILDEGYAITATDYPGLGSHGVHPYLISESEARSTVDAVRAARSVVGSLSDSWFAVGHSQGGQAAVATAEIADDYDGDLDFRGGAAFAPAPNMTPYVDEIASAGPLDQEFYEMMLVGLKTQYPEFRYADYLGGGARGLLPQVKHLCFDDLTTVFDDAALPASEFEPADSAARERLRDWFRDQEVGHAQADGPLLVLQGTADVVVPEPGTAAMVGLSQAHGTAVDYRTYDGATHGSVLVEGAPDLLEWLDAHRG